MDASSAHQDSLPLSSDALLERLRAQGVAFEYYEHIPLRTVEDAKTVQGVDVPAGPGRVDIKNFYLRDRKKRNYLVVLEQDRAVDLKALGATIGASNLSFGSAERLMEFLGVRPGAVSPLAMVNGAGAGVRLFMDAAVQQAEMVHVHPLVNDRTLAMTPAALLSVLDDWGAEVTWIAP
jgi:Ala-tRNA(Pro) deacylase